MVGEIRATGGLQSQLRDDRAGQITAQAGSGLGSAITQLANTGLGYLTSVSDIERVYDQREQASVGLELDTKFLQYQQDRAKEYAGMARDRSASPRGMTSDYNNALAEREKEFLATVPPRQREEYAARLARDRTERVGSAFRGELELMDNADSATLNTGLNTLGTNFKGGAISLEDAELEWQALVAKSALPEITKQAFIENGKATLQGLAFGEEVGKAAAGYGAVSDGSDGSLAAAGLTPQQAGVLTGISAEESSGYNVWNGGSTFEGYADHPARHNSAPGESTAAGKYQFILGTWDLATAAYTAKYGIKVPDFSPEWQDRVALFWAEKRFNELNGEGLTFNGVLASGDPAQLLKLKSVLGEPRGGNPLAVEWQGLGPMDDAKFLAMMGTTQGTGAASAPNVWTDPRFTNVSLDQKLSYANQAASLAEQQRIAAASQIKLERSAFLDDVYNLGYTGDPRAADTLRQSPQWDAEAEAKFQSGQSIFRNSEAAVGQISTLLDSGGGIPTDRKGDFGKWFGEASFVGIANGDKASYDKMRMAVEKARMFPEGSVDAFRIALGNSQTASDALRFLASAQVGDSNVLKRSGWTDDEISDVQLYANIARRSGSPEKAYEQYALAKDAATRLGKSPAVLTKEATEIWREAYPTADDVVDDLMDGWFTQQPDITLNENVGAEFMRDAGSSFQDGYKIYGTEEGARAYMEAYIKNTWGVTQTKTATDDRTSRGDTLTFGGDTNKSVLMKYPPEMQYSALDGDFSMLYESIEDFAITGGAQQTGAVLMADEDTDREVRAGKKPTYRVIGRGEFGEAMLLPGRFGGDGLQEKLNVPMEKSSEQGMLIGRVDASVELYSTLKSQLREAELFGGDTVGLADKIEAAKKDRDATLDAAVAAGYMSRKAADFEKKLGEN